jgi:coproporphyrinogen III oxidase
MTGLRWFGVVSKAGLVSLALITGMAVNTAWAGGHERLSERTAEQQELAATFQTFIDRMEEKYFARMEELNGETTFEEKYITTEVSEWDMRVARGPVVQKGGRMLGQVTKTTPNAMQPADVGWGRFYSLDIHPKTPLVGQIHAVILLQLYENGESHAMGWLGVLPGTRVPEDMAYLKATMDAVFAKHDKDSALYRRLICKGTEDTIAEFRRKPACVGASFYGPPVYRESASKSLDFMMDAYEGFTDAYFDTIERRQDDPVTEADIVAQKRMRKEWLVDQLFSDPYASDSVPFEVWSFGNVAPEINF